jgi:hypothetical protein
MWGLISVARVLGHPWVNALGEPIAESVARWDMALGLRSGSHHDGVE